MEFFALPSVRLNFGILQHGMAGLVVLGEEVHTVRNDWVGVNTVPKEAEGKVKKMIF